MYLSYRLTNQNSDVPALDMIESKLGLTMPKGYFAVEHYTYEKLGGYFSAKLSIRSEEIDNIKNQLNSFFGEEKTELPSLPNFSNTCTWWDLDSGEIETCYSRFVAGKTSGEPKSREVWAFITKEIDGKFMLYLSY